jgi:pimeloyl-ACP methyl ester carboxylesterase
MDGMAASLFVDTAERRVLAARPDKAVANMVVHVLDTPPASEATGGATCLLVHGFTQTCHSWQPLVEGPNGLRDRGYRSVCADLRGHGQSCWALDGNYSREAMVADIVAVADTLGLKDFCLFGLSLGGALATKLAADYPSRVRCLVLVDWAPWPGGKPTKGIGRIASLFHLRWDSFEHAVDAMHKANPRRSRENVALRMKEQLREADDGWRWNTDPAISKDAALRAEESPDVMWRNIEAVRCTTLMVRGGESDVVPQAQAELLVERLQNGTLALVSGAGHSVIGDRPTESISAIMPFLAKNGGATAARL